MRSWLVDARSAWQALRATRWTSLAAILTLGLGIGASTAVFGAAYGALLRPLPFRDAGDLVLIADTYTRGNLTSTSFKLDEVPAWRERFATASGAAGYATESMTIRGDGAPRSAQVGLAAGSLFDLLGIQPIVGRAFADDAASDTAVVSLAFARRMSGHDPTAVRGRSLVIAGRSWRVGGVLPESMDVLSQDVEVWLPARAVAPLTIFGRGDTRSFRVVARLSPGVSRAAATEAANRVLSNLRPGGPSNAWRATLLPLRDVLIGDTRPVLVALTAAALLVLLVACANVATLLVNRAALRARELTVRLALGASHARLVRTALVETAAIAVAGATAGWGAAHLFAGMLRPLLPGLATAIGVPLAGVAAAAAGGVTVLCGVAPVTAVRRTHLGAALRERTSTGGRASRRIRDGLVVAQVAMAVLLLAGAALLGRTLLVLLHTDIGLQAPGGVLTMRLPLAETTQGSGPARPAFVEHLLDAVRALPGVDAAGLGSGIPPARSSMVFAVSVVTDTSRQTRSFDMVSATDGYLDALGARTEKGRLFASADRLAGRPVAVLSEQAARYLAPRGDTLGRELNLGLPSSTGARVRPYVIGVVRDVRYSGLDASMRGNVYVPWNQLPLPAAFLVVRTSGDPLALAPPVLRIVRALDPTLPLEQPRTLEDEVQRSVSSRETRFAVVGLFAIVALTLAVVGLWGALARGVIERRREIAIRSALGATPAGLVRGVVARGVWLALGGALVGAGGALAAGRVLATLIFGISPYDPESYGVVLGATMVLALAACVLPARRAAAVDPLELLRAE